MKVLTFIVCLLSCLPLLGQDNELSQELDTIKMIQINEIKDHSIKYVVDGLDVRFSKTNTIEHLEGWINSIEAEMDSSIEMKAALTNRFNELKNIFEYILNSKSITVQNP
ncbi:hypothetical protein MNBD_BACTEROID06-174, partial [hydrothermal vent metagenome]